VEECQMQFLVEFLSGRAESSATGGDRKTPLIN